MRLAYIAVPVVVSAAIVSAVVVGLWLAGSASGERSKFSSLEVAPRDTDVFFAINTDPTSPEWLAVNNSLETLNAKDPIREAIDDALAEVNLEWERDIVPVAGDEAFMSVPDITKVGADSGWVGGVLLSDTEHAREVFETLRNEADAEPLLEEQYNGVTIYYSEPTDEPVVMPDIEEGDDDEGYHCDFEEFAFVCRNGDVICSYEDFFESPTPSPRNFRPTPTPDECFDFGFEDEPLTGGVIETGPTSGAVAFVDNVLALGASRDDAKKVIDVVQGRAESAEKNERLQEFRAQQKDDFLIWGYADLADVWAEADSAFGDLDVSGTDFDSDEALEQARKTYDRVGFSIGSHSDGFTFDLTVVHAPDFNPDDAFEPTEAYEPKIAEVLPADTMFYLSAFDLYNQSFLPAKDAFGDVDFGEGDFDDMVDDFNDETGVDLEADLLSLLTGEIAIAGNVSNFDDDPPDVTVFGIADVSDATKADSTIDRIGSYAEDQDDLDVSKDGDLHTWEADGDAVALTVRDGRAIVAFPDDALDTLSGGESLANNADWKRTMELLPPDKTFVGFLSIARILEEVRDVEDAEDEFADSTGGELTLDDLSAIRALGMSGTQSDNGFGFHLVLFMKEQ